MCLGYLFAGLLLLSAFTRFHFLPRKYVNPNMMGYLFQMRWNVYTRKVDDPMFHLYTIENNKPRLWDLRPFVPAYKFGLNRDYKIIAQEVMAVTNDTVELKQMRTYRVTVPAGKSLGDCIAADTLQFNEAVHQNSVLLKGHYLIVSEERLDWEKARAGAASATTYVVLPVNISRK